MDLFLSHLLQSFIWVSINWSKRNMMNWKQIVTNQSQNMLLSDFGPYSLIRQKKNIRPMIFMELVICAEYGMTAIKCRSRFIEHIYIEWGLMSLTFQFAILYQHSIKEMLYCHPTVFFLSFVIKYALDYWQSLNLFIMLCDVVSKVSLLTLINKSNWHWKSTILI